MYTNIRQSVIKSSRIFGVFFVLIATSCSSLTPRHQWIGKGIAAESKMDRGELDVAEREFRTLLKDAPDPERRRWIEYNLTVISLKKGNTEESMRAFGKIDGANIEDEYGAKALFQIAIFQDDTKLLWKVISKYPNSYPAEKALKKTFKNAEKNENLDAFILHTNTALQSHPEHELVDNLLLAEARAYRKTERPDKALESLRRLFAYDDTSALADDALWEIADIYKANQRWQEAIQTYLLFEDRIEDSYLVGEYTPHLVDDAFFEAGKIAMLNLSDYAQAEKLFSKYLYYFPDNMLADDVMWSLAETYRLSGQHEKRKETLTRLREKYPDSRYLRRISEAADE